jgi:hypothetical protein
MQPRSEPPQRPKPILDEITEAALDSFPASDPPGWNGLKIGPPVTHAQQKDESPEAMDIEVRHRNEDAAS